MRVVFLRVCRKSLLKTLWEKGEIARNEQFLLFPSAFSTLSENLLPFLPIKKKMLLLLFIVSQMQGFLSEDLANTMGNGENTGNQHFPTFRKSYKKVSSLGSLTLSQISRGFYVSAVSVS